VSVVTRLEADGRIERTADQPIVRAEEDFTLDVAAPDAKGWETADVGPRRARLSGSFAPGAEVPQHWTASLKAGDLTSRNRVRRAVTDFGLFTLHTFDERISNSVGREEFARARGELFAMMLPVFDEWLDHMYGDRYELDRLKAFARTTVVPLIEKMSWKAYEYGLEQPAGEPNPRELVRRTAEPLAEAGIKTDPDAPMSRTSKYLFRLWAAGKLRELLRKKPDGGQLSFDEAMAIASAGDDPAWREKSKKTGEAVVAARFGSKKAFDDKLARITARMTGVYGGPLAIFPRLRFGFDLEMPGEIVSANGTRTGPASIRWAFYEHALFPNGFAMKAESAVVDPAAQERVFGRVALADAAAVGRLLEAVRSSVAGENSEAPKTPADPKARERETAALTSLAATLRACRDAGSLEPLRAAAAKGDRPAVAALAFLSVAERSVGRAQ
jgi:hypothetical protein